MCAHGLSGFVQLRFLQPHPGLLAPCVNDRVLLVGFHPRARELPEVRNLGVECRVSVADEDELGTRRGTVTGLCLPRWTVTPRGSGLDPGPQRPAHTETERVHRPWLEHNGDGEEAQGEVLLKQIPPFLGLIYVSENGI